MKPAHGKLLVLLPGLGAVATTTIAGVELVRRGGGLPAGSFTQMGRVRLRDGRPVAVKDLLPLEPLDRIAFGAWDILKDDGATAAARCRVLQPEHLEAARPALEAVRPRRGAFDPERVRRIQADHVMAARGHRAVVEQLRRDIQEMRREAGASRAVMILTTSTETCGPLPSCGRSLEDLERALDRDDRSVTPTILYCYAALLEGVPFANATPNIAVELPALQELARGKRLPLAGKDLKSGQTLMKTAIAPALKARALGLSGWFSTNILGNRDGEVLDDPEAFKSKERTKSGVLDSILEPEDQPELYGAYTHKVAIHYYPPRGDDKEGWDNVDLFGWLGYPMQLKIDFLCKDSILAAPLVLDLALLLDAAARAGRGGVQEWLSFYFKSPAVEGDGRPAHDLFVQRARLEQALRALADVDGIDEGEGRP